MPAVLTELAPGLWHWSTRHPEWHPGAFGAEVGSYAIGTREALVLIDPLLPGGPDDPVLAALDVLAVGQAVHALITIGYHVRSAEMLCDRYDGALWGPANCASRLADPGRLRALEPGTVGPGGAQAFAIGRPRRSERPLWLPSHEAIAFGDTIVRTPDGELRLWTQEPVDDRKRMWFRDVFAPTLDPLLALPARRILVTHGEPVTEDGAAALAAATRTEPWYHRG